MANKSTMTPMEAWSIISSNMSELLRFRIAVSGNQRAYTEKEMEAEVIAFAALKEMEERMDGGKKA